VLHSLAEGRLKILDVVLRQRVHVRDKPSGDVHVALDERLCPVRALRKEWLEVLPVVADDRPELGQEQVVDFAAATLPVPRVLLLVLLELLRLSADLPRRFA